MRPYSVHVQGVHTQVEGGQVHGLEHLLEGLAAAALYVHDLLGVLLHGSLDEAQQVLLVHAGGRVDVRVHLERRDTAEGRWTTFRTWTPPPGSRFREPTFRML